MNAIVPIERESGEDTLEYWTDRARTAPAEGSGMLALEACQALYDAVFGRNPPLDRKRAVFAHVASGNLVHAVAAMLPEGAEWRTRDLMPSRVEASLCLPDLAAPVTARGRSGEFALLGCLLTLPLVLGRDTARRLLA